MILNFKLPRQSLFILWIGLTLYSIITPSNTHAQDLHHPERFYSQISGVYQDAKTSEIVSELTPPNLT